MNILDERMTHSAEGFLYILSKTIVNIALISNHLCFSMRLKLFLFYCFQKTYLRHARLLFEAKIFRSDSDAAFLSSHFSDLLDASKQI